MDGGGRRWKAVEGEIVGDTWWAEATNAPTPMNPTMARMVTSTDKCVPVRTKPGRAAGSRLTAAPMMPALRLLRLRHVGDTGTRLDDERLMRG